jgi:hypothetical protein
VAGFAALEALVVWQCAEADAPRRPRAADAADAPGAQRYRRHRIPGAAGGAGELRALGLTGGIWTTQGLPSLATLRELPKLERLNLMSAKVVDGDLGPLCDLRHLSPARPVAAQLRAGGARPRGGGRIRSGGATADAPRLRHLGTRARLQENATAAARCLFLRRKKLLWCPSCEGAKLAALLADFERLVEEKRREREAGPRRLTMPLHIPPPPCGRGLGEGSRAGRRI